MSGSWSKAWDRLQRNSQHTPEVSLKFYKGLRLCSANWPRIWRGGNFRQGQGTDYIALALTITRGHHWSSLSSASLFGSYERRSPLETGILQKLWTWVIIEAQVSSDLVFEVSIGSASQHKGALSNKYNMKLTTEAGVETVSPSLHK